LSNKKEEWHSLSRDLPRDQTTAESVTSLVLDSWHNLKTHVGGNLNYRLLQAKVSYFAN